MISPADELEPPPEEKPELKVSSQVVFLQSPKTGGYLSSVGRILQVKSELSDSARWRLNHAIAPNSVYISPAKNWRVYLCNDGDNLDLRRVYWF